MWLIAGLGNPGPAHKGHRHNAGFMAVDRIAQRYWPMGQWRSRFEAETLEFSVEAQKVLAVKPQTFMNLSGGALGDVARYYKIHAHSVLVIHDDLDLDFGRLDLKQGGGHGGHNGLKSIDGRIGQDYWRLRIGIGHPVKAFPIALSREQKDQLVTNHVLNNFSNEEAAAMDPVLNAISGAIPDFLKGEADLFRKRLRDDLPATKQSV